MDLFTKYNCTNCQDDITGIRVHCAECENFDLCLQCFAAGAEIGHHQNNHDYQFMDTGTAILSVFRGKGAWTAREEIRLLDAIEQFGFGNWEDISKHIETKSAEDAKEEYVNKFVNGTIGRHTWIPAQTQRPTLVDHTADDVGPLGGNALQRLPPLDITTEEATQLGYMPNRDSFEREYDPTAEQLISTMALNADDTEADYLLKLAHVDMYTRRLRERVRRKRLVRDYQLVSNYFRNRNYAQHPGMTREQKEFRDRFRVFAQFYTSNEYERLLGSLEREKELRIRLAELYRYRYNGLTKIDECRHFEQHAAMATHRSTGPYGHGKTDNMHHSTGNHRQQEYFLHSQQHNSKKADLLNVNEANLNSIVLNNMHHTGDPISSGVLLPNKNCLDSCRASSTHTTITPITPMNTSMMSGIQLTTTDTMAMMVMGEGQMNLKTGIGGVVEMIPINQQQQQLQEQQCQMLPPQQVQRTQLNDPIGVVAVAGSGQNVKLEDHKNDKIAKTKSHSNNNNGSNNNWECQPLTYAAAEAKGCTTQTKSRIVRSQLDELKHLQQQLGVNLLSINEKQLCQNFNLPPSSYLAVKTLLLSGAPLTNLSPMENFIRKYFMKVGWSMH